MPEANAKPRRRWFQFSLRTLLSVVALAAGLLVAWLLVQSSIPDDRQRQFDMLAQAKGRLFSWSKGEGVPLHQVEYIVPFVETDFNVHVLFFVETDEQVSLPQMREAETVFIKALRDVGYPEQHLALLTFEVDSHERVERDFEGNYFYRLR